MVKQLRYLLFFAGLVFLSFGINMMTTIKSFGLSPYDSLFIALYQNFGVSIGFWIFVINFTFIIIVFLMDKAYLTVGTVVTMLLISVFVDAIGSSSLIMNAIYSLPHYITFICGNVCIGFGIGIYVSSQICVAPQEAFVLAVSKRTKWTFRRTEISLAITFLSLSFLLHGPIFYGTLILSFTTGWMIQASIGIGSWILKKAERNVSASLMESN